MICCRGARTDHGVNPLIITMQTSDAIEGVRGGEIHCLVVDAPGDVEFEWYDNEGKAALLQLSDDRSVAYEVEPGDYTVVVQDVRSGQRVASYASIAKAEIPTISGYEVLHATSDTARDGQIKARVSGMRDCRFLWTTGIVTDAPELHDAMPGKYTVTPIHREQGFVTHLHACPPAVIHMSRVTACDHI